MLTARVIGKASGQQLAISSSVSGESRGMRDFSTTREGGVPDHRTVHRPTALPPANER